MVKDYEEFIIDKELFEHISKNGLSNEDFIIIEEAINDGVFESKETDDFLKSFDIEKLKKKIKNDEKNFSKLTSNIDKEMESHTARTTKMKQDMDRSDKQFKKTAMVVGGGVAAGLITAKVVQLVRKKRLKRLKKYKEAYRKENNTEKKKEIKERIDKLEKRINRDK